MKTKWPLSLIFLFCFALMLIWLFWRKQPAATVRRPSNNLATGSGPIVRRTNVTKGVSQSPSLNPTANLPLALPGQGATSELSNAMQGWEAKVQRPIEFYGKVIDQNERPVTGASVELIWTQFYPEKSYATNLLTDDGGLFSLQNVIGAGLGVSVSKVG